MNAVLLVSLPNLPRHPVHTKGIPRPATLMNDLAANIHHTSTRQGLYMNHMKPVMCSKVFVSNSYTAPIFAQCFSSHRVVINHLQCACNRPKECQWHTGVIDHVLRNEQTGCMKHSHFHPATSSLTYEDAFPSPPLVLKRPK